VFRALPEQQVSTSLWHMIASAGPFPQAIMLLLVVASVLSWTVIFSKWKIFKEARLHNTNFLKAFRKSDQLPVVAAAVQQFPLSPLVALFEFGYEEVDRQVKLRGTVTSQPALERALQLGISEELTKLERNMNWLATAAAVAPFVGLLGTVWGIIDAFQALGNAGSASLRAVAPGISEALFTTALGLFAAIPAAVAYNYFSHALREMGARMDDFTLEFLNLAERSHGE
jgi:biopolymer transport protein TolQ